MHAWKRGSETNHFDIPLTLLPLCRHCRRVLFRPLFVLPLLYLFFFLPFVGLFPLYYARPSRLQWSRVENRVGWKVHRESEDLFYFTIEEILPRIKRGVVHASIILSISSNHRNRSFVDAPLKYSVWTVVVYVTRLKRHFPFFSITKGFFGILKLILSNLIGNLIDFIWIHGVLVSTSRNSHVSSIIIVEHTTVDTFI